MNERAKQTACIVTHIPSCGSSVHCGEWPSLFLTVMVLCFTAFAVGAQEKPDKAPTKTETKVIVLRPLIEFEALQANTRNLVGQLGASGDFEAKLLATATGTVTARELTAVVSETLQNTTAGERLKQLQPLSSRLARGIVNEEAKTILNDLATLTGNSAVLVQFLRIKTGPASTWNPWTGQITSAMSSTILQVALVSCQSGQVLWKNESVARKVYRAADPKFAKWLETVYETLGTRSN